MSPGPTLNGSHGSMPVLLVIVLIAWLAAVAVASFIWGP